MNKTELIESIAKNAELTKKESSRALEAMLDAITKSLKKGKKVSLMGFGSFTTKKRASRTGRNPQTGASIKIKAKKVAKFNPGKALREAVAKKR